MDSSTHASIVRYYAQLSDEDLSQNKAEIGAILRSYTVGKDITNLKDVIEIINKELAIRKAKDADS